MFCFDVVNKSFVEHDDVSESSTSPPPEATRGKLSMVTDFQLSCFSTSQILLIKMSLPMNLAVVHLSFPQESDQACRVVSCAITPLVDVWAMAQDKSHVIHIYTISQVVKRDLLI